MTEYLQYAARRNPNFGPAGRAQAQIEPIASNGVRILALCREHGATMIGEAGVAVIELVQRGFVTVTPCESNRWRVEATPEGLAAIADVWISNQDHGAERHNKKLFVPTRHKPEQRNWRTK